MLKIIIIRNQGWLRKNISWHFISLIVKLGFFVPFDTFSLIWRGYLCRWRAADIELCSALKFKFFITLSFTAYQLHTLQNSHSWEWSIFRRKYTYINTCYTQYILSSNCIRTSYFHTIKNKLAQIKHSYEAFCVK